MKGSRAETEKMPWIKRRGFALDKEERIYPGNPGYSHCSEKSKRNGES